MKIIVKNILGFIRCLLYAVKYRKGVYIGKHCSIKGKNKIFLDENVTIRPYAQIWCSNGKIKISSGSEIGERCRISIANSLEIGKKVLISPNVYITDCDHDYRNIEVPVIDQGIVNKGQKVIIGEGSYIGINTVIIGNVSIGKHCIIGANSVVTKSIDDYCVAVGTPAKVIKKYDLNEGWKSIKN